MFNRSFHQFRIYWSCSLPFNNLKWVWNCRSGVYSPRYFHTAHSVNNHPHWIHFPFQMSWPTIAKCYEEIAEDPTVLHLFSPEEYSSIQELPCLGTLWFRLISEGCFACIASPNNWGKTRVECLILTSIKRSGETTKSLIVLSNGVGERVLGMVTVLCHPNWAKREACDSLSTLCQCDLSKLSMLVLRRYSNTPYIPRWTSCSPYLDVDTFSGGSTSAQFPLDRLHFHQLLPFNRRGRKAGDIPLSSRDPMGEFTGGTSSSFWSNLLVSPHASSSTIFGRGHPDWGRSTCHPTSTQTEGGQAITPPSNSYTVPIKPELNWNMSSSRRCRSWLKGMNISELNRPGGMQSSGHRWLTKLMPPSRRYFPRQVWQRPSSCCPGAFLLHKWSHNHCGSKGWGHPHNIWALSHCIWAWASWLTSSRSLRRSDSSTKYFPSTIIFPARYPLVRYSHGKESFFWPPSHPLTRKMGPLSQWFTWPSSH